MSEKRKWRKVRIDQIGSVITGHTPRKKIKDYYGDDYVWIKPTDIERDARYVRKTEEKYSLKAYKKYKTSLLPPLSTCVVTIGTVGEKICLTNEPSFTNQSINTIIPNKKKFDPMFVFYLMKYNLHIVAMRNPGTASGRHHVSKSNFSGIELDVPDLPSQRIIGSILSEHDNLIENNTKRIEILEQIAKLIHDEWFVKFRFPNHENVVMIDSDQGKIPEEWNVKKIGKVLKTISGSTPSTKISEYWNNGDVIWFTPSDLTANNQMFIFDSIKKISTLGFQSCSTSMFPPYSVMMTSRATIGVVAINTKTACTNQGFVTIIPNEQLSAWQIYFWVENNKDLIKQIASGATYKEISKSEFKNLLILVPSKEITDLFVGLITPLMKQVEVLLMKNRNLKVTRNILIHQLITGKIHTYGLDI